MSIITSEEQVKFDLIQGQINDLNSTKRKLNETQTEIIGAVFLRFLQAGNWTVHDTKDDSGLLKIQPKDREAEG